MKATWNHVVLAGALLAICATAHAQQRPAPNPPPQAPASPAPQRIMPAVPLKVDLVLVRYQGDRRISSLPYSLSVNADNRQASLRMGAEVPIPTVAITPRQPSDAGPPVTQPVQYRSIGTNIDCSASAEPGLDSGQYRISISIEDTSLYPSSADMPGTAAGVPTFRSFRAHNELILRDGQKTEFLAATDKVSGEVIKAEVTLTVLK